MSKQADRQAGLMAALSKLDVTPAAPDEPQPDRTMRTGPGKLLIAADSIERAQTATANAVAKVARLETELATLKANVKHSREVDLNDLVIQLTTDLSASHATAEAHRQAAETTRTELAKSELRLEGLPKLEAEVGQLKSAIEAERRQRSQAEQAAAVATARLDKTEAQVEDLQARLNRAESEARTAMADNGKLREQASSLQANFEVAVRDGNQARDEARRAEAEAAELRGQLLELRAAVKPELPATVRAQIAQGANRLAVLGGSEPPLSDIPRRQSGLADQIAAMPNVGVDADFDK
jgi:chromosome segregation ATPase